MERKKYGGRHTLCLAKYGLDHLIALLVLVRLPTPSRLAPPIAILVSWRLARRLFRFTLLQSFPSLLDARFGFWAQIYFLKFALARCQSLAVFLIRQILCSRWRTHRCS